MFEPWPDEPDETEVERRWGNPERELPRVPEVSTDETDVDPHVAQTFWVSVIFANAAVFGVSLGLMLWYFRGQALLGGVLLGAGLLAGFRTYTSYRDVKRDDSAETDADEQDAADEDTGDSADQDTDDIGDEATGDIGDENNRGATGDSAATNGSDADSTVTATSPGNTDANSTDTAADSTERNG